MTRQKIDLELINKVKNGDNKAVVKIYNYYKDKVTNFILRRYPNDTYTEDNVSEILIKVFENIDKYSKNKAKFNTWVLSIAKNHMLDSIKKNQPIYTNFAHTGEIDFNNNNTTVTSTCCFTHQGDVMTFSEPVSMCSASPDYQIQLNDSLTLISDSVSTCDYTMMSMKYVDGYNYTEIGNEFNLTSEEVSNKVNYNKSKIKKKYEKKGK